MYTSCESQETGGGGGGGGKRRIKTPVPLVSLPGSRWPQVAPVGMG